MGEKSLNFLKKKWKNTNKLKKEAGQEYYI